MDSPDDDLGGYDTLRQRRVKVVAWVVIISLVLAGGGATVLAVLFG